MATKLSQELKRRIPAAVRQSVEINPLNVSILHCTICGHGWAWNSNGAWKPMPRGWWKCPEGCWEQLMKTDE